ncbi:hypothetical protein ACLBOM_03580 [Escherichia coli]
MQAPGYRYEQSDPEQQPLWHYDSARAKRQPQTLTFIPWFSWANRGEGEMRIWVNEEKHRHPEVGWTGARAASNVGSTLPDATLNTSYQAYSRCESVGQPHRHPPVN